MSTSNNKSQQQSTTWTEGPIDGVEERSLTFHTDERGWLLECFRADELPAANRPLMAYISNTRPGVVRGPHAHVEQSDLFVFFDGTFEIYLWDNREQAATYSNRRVLRAGASNPLSLVVPPGVVHAYRNAGDTGALIVNGPNRLYGGWNREDEVDEIRYEERSDHPFTVDQT